MIKQKQKLLVSVSFICSIYMIYCLHVSQHMHFKNLSFIKVLGGILISCQKENKSPPSYIMRVTECTVHHIGGLCKLIYIKSHCNICYRLFFQKVIIYW